MTHIPNFTVFTFVQTFFANFQTQLDIEKGYTDGKAYEIHSSFINEYIHIQVRLNAYMKSFSIPRQTAS